MASIRTWHLQDDGEPSVDQWTANQVFADNEEFLLDKVEELENRLNMFIGILIGSILAWLVVAWKLGELLC